MVIMSICGNGDMCMLGNG